MGKGTLLDWGNLDNPSCCVDEVKKYQIIYADPPWKISYLKGGKKAGMIGGGHPVPYERMSDSEIKTLPVSNILDDNALLFLWAVESRIPVVKEIMKSWGFRYSGVAFVWNKRSKYDPTKVRTTLGFYTRHSCEFCFLGTHGNTKGMVKHHYVLQLVDVPSITRQHSRKPDEVRDRIVKLCGDTPRIELFARQKTSGWDVWGNEVESDIELGV